jgi:hypothetical protein
MTVGLLQNCGTGMIVAIGESAHGVEEQAGGLAQALVERGWDGDAVLADLVSQSLASTPTGRQPLLVDVGELADVIEGGSGGWLDLGTGIAWPQEIMTTAPWKTSLTRSRSPPGGWKSGCPAVRTPGRTWPTSLSHQQPPTRATSSSGPSEAPVRSRGSRPL